MIIKNLKHTAAEKGPLEAARLLCDRGANKQIRNADGQTPYDLARTKKYESLYDLLKP